MKLIKWVIIVYVVRLAVTAAPASIWNQRQATDVMHILRVLEELGHRPVESVQGWCGNRGGGEDQSDTESRKRGVRYVNRRTDGHSGGMMRCVRP